MWYAMIFAHDYTRVRFSKFRFPFFFNVMNSHGTLRASRPGLLKHLALVAAVQGLQLLLHQALRNLQLYGVDTPISIANFAANPIRPNRHCSLRTNLSIWSRVLQMSSQTRDRFSEVVHCDVPFLRQRPGKARSTTGSPPHSDAICKRILPSQNSTRFLLVDALVAHALHPVFEDSKSITGSKNIGKFVTSPC